MDAPGDQVRLPHDIDWNSLNKQRFYLLNGMFSVFARALQYPPMLIKTRLQVQQIKPRVEPSKSLVCLNFNKF